MAKLENHIVHEDEAGLRLDRWFKRHFAHIVHSQLQKLLRTGQVRVDGKRAETATRLLAGQAIRVPPIAKAGADVKIKGGVSTHRLGKLKSLILYEDEDVVAINKPAGMAVQGGTGIKESLDDLLMAFAVKGQGKPKLVHRLDRETTGVLLIARNAFAASKLTESFRDRRTEKIYWAITQGVPKPVRGIISAPLVKRGEVMRIVPPGKEDEIEGVKSANTLYQVMEHAKKQVAFVALWPLTGRTHQLRVHLQYIGTPILHDGLYGVDAGDALPLNEMGRGLHLHARRLIIPHPRRGMIDVTAPLSPEMQKTWHWFGFDDKADADFSDAEG